jgi:hypothetical protein
MRIRLGLLRRIPLAACTNDRYSQRCYTCHLFGIERTCWCSLG